MKSINKKILSNVAMAAVIGASLSSTAYADQMIVSSDGKTTVGAFNNGASVVSTASDNSINSSLGVNTSSATLNSQIYSGVGAGAQANIQTYTAGGNATASISAQSGGANNTMTGVTINSNSVNLWSVQTNGGLPGPMTTATLSGVSAGVNSTDAVNVSQLNAALGNATDTTAQSMANTAQVQASIAGTQAIAAQSTANSALTTSTTNATNIVATQSIAASALSTAGTAYAAVQAQTTQINNLRNNLSAMEAQLNNVDIDAQRGIASLAAINNAPVPSQVGKFTIALGAGHYKTQSATGLSFAYRGGEMTGGAILTGGVGYSGNSDPVYKLGAAWEL